MPQSLQPDLRSWLLDWVPDPAFLREGFLVGLPNNPDRGDLDGSVYDSPLPIGEVLVRIPCQGSAKGAFIPVLIVLQDTCPERENLLTNMDRLRIVFFHAVVCVVSGELEFCDDYGTIRSSYYN